MKMTFLLLTVAACLVAKTHCCEANCQTCRDLFPGDYYCLACKTGYEVVTTYGICIQDSTIANCALYDQTLDCLTCQPSFQQSVNLCSKMFDGCLLYKKGACSLCQPGSFLSPRTQSCTVSQLHCTEIAGNGSCTNCSSSYSLRNGRCLYNSSLCLSLNADTGLCSECVSGAELVGYTCVSGGAEVINNCYLAQEDRNVTCTYCKSGYGAYFGSCWSLQEILSLLEFPSQKCRDITYLKDNQPSCLSAATNASYQNCLSVDLGFSKCLICNSSFTLNQNNLCVPIITLYCKELNPKGDSCLKCKSAFYLENGNCLPYPPFCLNYSQGCTACQPSFDLVQGRCMDPNCQTVNLVTGYCQICFINYQINPSGVCKYIDPNCKKTGALGDCLECQKGYILKSNGLCTYQDTNCLSFDDRTGLCTLCKPFYYFNRQGQICIPLPTNCMAADIAGRCTQCMAQYTLTSNYQCLFISSLKNCNMVSASNFNFCTSCVQGFFADQNGQCQKLPPFCQQIDQQSYVCTQCSPNGVMKGGTCVDKNCQIFDSGGSCLACLASFQFGQLGECVPETRDANCKEYQFSICKSCSERYYFDFQFNCVPVSAFCKTYDANSGACTSCYSGYQLTNNADCTVAPFNSLFQTNDVLDSCMTQNADGQCIKCNPNFNEVIIMAPLSDLSQPLVNCIQKIRDNSYCLHYNSTTNNCTECVSRMYAVDGLCHSIDENCDLYDSQTGDCKSCYPGFTINPKNKKNCIIINAQDPNCQVKAQVSGCLKCYSRYYYEPETLTCTQVNPQCATYNTTNGHCTSCYPGYQLNNYLCELKVNEPREKPHPQGQKPPGDSRKPFSFEITIPNCLTLDFESSKCLACEWGFSLVNDSCLPKDPHCKVFEDSNSLACLECYDGYSVFPENQTRCILSTLLLPHCLKYNQEIACQQCEDGYVLTPNNQGGTPAFLCNIIDPNCISYNSTKKGCEKCAEGHVLQGRSCIFPVYGVDPHCLLYSQGMCVKCEEGWEIQGYQCAKK